MSQLKMIRSASRILAVSALCFLSSCQGLLKQADLQTFVETGEANVLARSETYSPGSASLGRIPSGKTVTCGVVIINPKSFNITYSIGWNVSDALFLTSPPSSPMPSDPTHLLLSFMLDPALAEHKTITFSLGKYVASLNKTYDPDSFSVICDSPPNATTRLSAVVNPSDQKSILAVLLPTQLSDDDLARLRISWTREGTTSTNTATFDISSLKTAPSPNPFSSSYSYDCYFHPSDIAATYGYSYSVVVIDRAGQESSASSTTSQPGITIDPPPTTYSGLEFPSSVSIVQGQAFSAVTGNATLAAIPSGWAWYIDGALQSETSPSFALSPLDTSSMLGTYQIAATVTYGGVSYSGRIALTVSRGP